MTDERKRVLRMYCLPLRTIERAIINGFQMPDYALPYRQLGREL